MLIEQTPEVLFKECLSLPRNKENTNILYFLKNNHRDLDNFFFARRDKIFNILNYLKDYHPGYSRITIDNETLDNLPALANSLVLDNKKLKIESNNPNYNQLSSENIINISSVSRPIPPSSVNQVSPLPQPSSPSIVSYEAINGWLSNNFFYLFSDENSDCTNVGRNVPVSLKEAVPHYLSLSC